MTCPTKQALENAAQALTDAAERLRRTLTEPDQLIPTTGQLGAQRGLAPAQARALHEQLYPPQTFRIGTDHEQNVRIAHHRIQVALQTAHDALSMHHYMLCDECPWSPEDETVFALTGP